jgi:PAS domain S-box-containing protein
MTGKPTYEDLEKRIRVLEEESSKGKQAEEVLRVSEERYRRISQITTDITYSCLTGEEGVFSIDWMSGNAEKITGYTIDEVKAQSCWRSLVIEEDIPLFEKNVVGLSAGQSISVEFRIRHKNGEIIWVTSYAECMADAKTPGCFRLYGRLVDITERKRAEDELNKREQNLRSILQAAPIGIGFVMQRVIKGANDTLCDMLGYAGNELIGKSARILYPSEEEFEIVGRDKYAQIEKQGVGSVQTRFVRKDGRIIDVLLSSAPLNPQDLSEGVTFTAIDITERKRAEAALRESKGRLRIILESMQAGIVIIDPETHTIVDVNQIAAELIGNPKEKIIGSICHSYICPADKGKCPVTDLGNTIDNSERILLSANGNRIPIIKTVVPIMLTGKRHLVESFIDITERKSMEEQRRILEERLQRSEKMEALGILAGGVAHDLNNVLGIVVGYSELLLMKAEESSPIRSDALHIMEGGERAAAIVQDLLTMARRGVHTKKVVNLNTAVMNCQKRPEFEKVLSFRPRVRIQTKFESNLLNIMGSPVHLGKTIINLLSNAVEAMPEGGLVKITTSNQYLDRPIHGYDEVREGDYVVLSVSDEGEGIAVRDIKRIFEPFYTKKVMGKSGTGLGLAVVWGTVKDHHGYIDVQSEKGKGSTFMLYFPVSREEIGKDEKTISLVDYMGKGESILVVDDVKEQRDLATSMLERLEYQVATIASGEAAIEYVKNKKVDLIVLDMIMDPGIDGMETYRRILEIIPDQKAVIVSGFSETDRVRKAQEMGAGAFVRKPYILEKIGLAIRKELDRKDARKNQISEQ